MGGVLSEIMRREKNWKELEQKELCVCHELLFMDALSSNCFEMNNETWNYNLR